MYPPKTKNGSARAFPFSVDAVVAVNRQCLGCNYARLRLRSFIEPAPRPPMRRTASTPGSGAPVGTEGGTAETSVIVIHSSLPLPSFLSNASQVSPFQSLNAVSV